MTRKNHGDYLPYDDDEEDDDSFLKKLKEEKTANNQTRVFGSPRKHGMFASTTRQLMKPVADSSSKAVLKRMKSKEGELAPIFEMPPTEERLLKIHDYRMAWFPRLKGNSTGGFMVDSKEGRSCVHYDNICYIYGGYSPSFDQVIFQGFNLATKKMFEVKSKVSKEPQPRAYHSCDLLEDNMLIFGGETFSLYSESRLMTNDLIVFNLKSYEYTKMHIHDNIDPRKHHASCVISTYLVISGGVDEENKTLNQFLVLNIAKQSESSGLYSRPKDFGSYRLVWKKAPLEVDLEPISNHTMTSIYTSSPKSLITSQNKIKQNMIFETKKVLLEGLYIFGGMNKKGEFLNTLTIINTSNLESNQTLNPGQFIKKNPLDYLLRQGQTTVPTTCPIPCYW